MNPQAKYVHAFNLINGIGPINFKKIINYFNSAKNAWLAPLNEFVSAGLDKIIIEQIKNRRPEIDPDEQIARLIKQGIDLILLDDPDYPKLLKEIYTPPFLLYLRGRLESSDQLSLSIVGTRKISSYGRQITPIITKGLIQAGFTIVSGLAKGIDTLAHQTAIAAGGRTIAVLGSGIDRKSVYPYINQDLAEKICQQGALISEFTPGTEPRPQYFPQRNRIIAGLSLGTLVIEAPERSGALVTAKYALEQNREVFAVPGAILSTNSIGPNNLIKLGAKLTSQVNDIIEELNL